MAGPSAEGGEDERAQGDGDVLVEGVQQHHAHPAVVPPPVDEQETPEESKLRDRVIARVDRLQAFLPADPDTDTRGANHIDVVRSITDRQRNRLGHNMLADQVDHLRLLRRRDAARDDRCALASEELEMLAEARLAEDTTERLAVDHQRKLFLARGGQRSRIVMLDLKAEEIIALHAPDCSAELAAAPEDDVAMRKKDRGKRMSSPIPKNEREQE